MTFTFLIPSTTVRSISEKSIKSIVGGQERIDVFSRILFNLHRWVNRIESPINLIFYLSHPEEQLTFTIQMNKLTDNIRSELDSTNLLVNIINSPEDYGVNVQKQDFFSLLKKISAESKFFYLTPTGIDISKAKRDIIKYDDVCFILGSQLDLLEEQELLLQEFNPSPISLGSKEYLASHVITIIGYHLFSVHRESVN